MYTDGKKSNKRQNYNYNSFLRSNLDCTVKFPKKRYILIGN